MEIIIKGQPKEIAAQGKSALERLENGEETFNNLRKEAGLTSIKGGEQLLKKE